MRYFLLAGALVLGDQALKLWVMQVFALGESRPLIGGVVYLSLVHNTGMAFGLARSHPGFFVLISSAAITVFSYLLLRSSYRSQSDGWILWGMSLILGGAAGNLIDRVRFGYVIDFLDLRWWPVFNLADSAITVGAVLIGIRLFIHERRVRQ
ncbi:MAG: signal peptidase II [Candidatus Omnitrophica bacterium]|nr:signal peptidase II [Candidatus Omnitrophota bacterium]